MDLRILLNYVCDNYDDTECELNEEVHKEPKSTIVIFVQIVTWK